MFILTPDRVFEGGTFSAGYRVSIDMKKGLMEVEMWGDWPPVTGEKLRQDVQAAIKMLSGKQWKVLGDLTRFNSISEGIRGVILSLMIEARRSQFERGAVAIAREQKGILFVLRVVTGIAQINLTFCNSVEEAMREVIK